ncbi:hypothetical protein ACOSP7_028645 [Xanthoceras sorbifolium]
MISTTTEPKPPIYYRAVTAQHQAPPNTAPLPRKEHAQTTKIKKIRTQTQLPSNIIQDRGSQTRSKPKLQRFELPNSAKSQHYPRPDRTSSSRHKLRWIGEERTPSRTEHDREEWKNGSAREKNQRPEAANPVSNQEDQKKTMDSSG